MVNIAFPGAATSVLAPNAPPHAQRAAAGRALMDSARCTAFDEFASKPYWVAWRNEPRGPKGKPTKVPYGAGAASQGGRPDHLARSAPRRKLSRTASSTAWAAVLATSLAMSATICSSPASISTCCIMATLAPWAAAILNLIRTYAETSPSGNGIKSFFRIAAEDVRPLPRPDRGSCNRLGLPPRHPRRRRPRSWPGGRGLLQGPLFRGHREPLARLARYATPIGS